MHKRVILAVDFDGTLCQHRFPEIGPVIQPAIDTLKRLQNRIRTRLILWTCREDSKESQAMGHAATLQGAVDFCCRHELEFDAINANWEMCDGHAQHKVVADFYIDDRGIDWDYDEDEQQHWDRILRRSCTIIAGSTGYPFQIKYT
jgi:hypothetical protein